MQISAVHLQIFCVKTELRLKMYTASQKMWLLKHVDIKKLERMKVSRLNLCLQIYFQKVKTL